jgi:predicted nuclease of predicted toxin-antitoxin system
VISVLSDENLHADIITGLRQKGIHMVTAIEVGLSGRKDEEILEYSEKHELLLLSGDKDFGGLIEF